LNVERFCDWIWLEWILLSPALAVNEVNVR